MPYPKIPEAQTATVRVLGRTLMVQEWPALPAMRFTSLVSGILKEVLTAVAATRKKTGSTWRVPVLDTDGRPTFMPEVDDDGKAVMDANGTQRLVPVTELNVDMIVDLVSSASKNVETNFDAILMALDAAIVSDDQEANFTLKNVRDQIRFGDLVLLLKAVIEVNFKEGSSLGNALGGLGVKPTTPLTTPSPKLTPQNGPPAPPQPR